ncbi:MAG: GNVR domain-containing protein [Alphaproteobacteria bacterium]
MEARQRPAVGDDGELRLIDLWRIVWRGRLIIFLCASLGAVAAVVIALSMDNIFRGQVVLAPAAEEGGPGGAGGGALAGVAEIAGIRIPGKVGVSKADESIAVVRSRRFTEDFIRREGLLPILLPEWDDSPGPAARAIASLMRLAGLAKSGGEPSEAERERRMIWDAFKVFHAIRQIDVEQRVGLVTLSVDWTDPVLAAEWANKLVAYINRESRAREIDAAEKNIVYLQEQVDVTVDTERRRLLFNLIEGETRRIMLANSRDEFAFRIIDPAVVPQEKFRPQRAMMVALGLMGGLVLGLFIVVVRHALRDGGDGEA